MGLIQSCLLIIPWSLVRIQGGCCCEGVFSTRRMKCLKEIAEEIAFALHFDLDRLKFIEVRHDHTFKSLVFRPVAAARVR